MDETAVCVVDGKRGYRRKATVAVPRKMAVIMHAIWSLGFFYEGAPPPTRRRPTRAGIARKCVCWARIDEPGGEARGATFRLAEPELNMGIRASG